MDEDTKTLILKRMDENHTDLKEVKAALLTIQMGIVGQVHCEAYRRNFENVLQSHDTRIRDLKTICDGYVATKSTLIDGVDLKEAKDDAIQHFGTRYDDLEARMRKHEDRDRLWELTWDTVKGNSVLKGAFGVWFLAIALIAYDRIRVFAIEYGTHTAIVVVGIVIVGLIMLWCLVNRDATTKATKKIMGLQ
jgi:hypothetical protein